MPRNIGTGIYTIPPDTEGIPDQTIESVPYNFYIHDVETDLNNARPIIAGGTGANDADEALFNLGGENAKQLVDNYDSWIWSPGSFRSAAGATNAPVSGHAFAGIVYLNENYLNPPTNANVLVSARDMNDTVVPSRVYVREKKANVWGAWTVADATTLAFVAATYAPINSPVFTGDARAETPIPTDNDTSIATTAHVKAYIATIPLAANAAPFDAVIGNCLQINGGMEISQELALGTSVTTNNSYICDGWKLARTGTMAVSASTNVSSTVTPLGFQNLLSVTVGTAQTSLGASDTVYVYQPIEGYRISRLAWGTVNAQSITIGFWSAHVRTGIHSGSVGNGSRSYTFTYTQATTSLMQYNTVTVPGDTTGTWQATTSTGFTITFAIAAGATLTASAANTWLAGNFVAAPGQVNGVAATSDVFRITGVAIVPGVYGAVPSSRSALLMRPFGDELQICKRYYEETPVYSAGNYSGAFGFSTMFSVEKRIVPASTVKAGSSSVNFTLSDFNGSSTKHLAVRGSTAGSYSWTATVINDARL